MRLGNHRRNAAKYPPIVVPFTAPPSAALINAILEHADIRHDLGDGRALLRISQARAAKRDMRQLLGRETPRLKDISILWDDDEDEMIRVCDDAGAEAPEDVSDDDTFELTEAALAYIADFQARR
ncbi:MAG TPA: hypothetical protein VGL58_12570 [Caulobacteraceae bacterium]|jgi:hypothetical protein